MLHALLLSIGQLGDRAILRVFAKSLALTLALLATIGAGLWFGARAVALWLGAGEATSTLAGLAGALAAIALGWLIFRAIAIAVVGLFADEVVAAVEARHYPDALRTARPVPFARSLAMGAGSATRAIVFNLIAVPLYLALLLTGIGTPIGFLAINAVLLGRDLSDMVAARHMPMAELSRLRGETRASRLMLGAVATGLLLIPFVNLAAPVLGAALATHRFHRRLAR